jgi:hypothetical protein
MRNSVIFRHPAGFVPLSYEDGVLAVSGAQWFIPLLRQVPGLQIDDELCQEDWGVVVFARRERKKFWIGLSFWPDGEHLWLAHFHHGSFAWLQRLISSRKSELQKLVLNFHETLAKEPAISDIVWYEEGTLKQANPTGFSKPSDGVENK